MIVGGRKKMGKGVFFFSSRRRHTRFTSDWSSDVCSSDLGGIEGPGDGHQDQDDGVKLAPNQCGFLCAANDLRSEERRLGKERRSRWWPYH